MVSGLALSSFFALFRFRVLLLVFLLALFVAILFLLSWPLTFTAAICTQAATTLVKPKCFLSP